MSDEVSVGTNEVAQATSIGGDSEYSTSYYIQVVKDGITNSVLQGGRLSAATLRVAGPAVLRLTPNGSAKAWMTVRIEPGSFPPGLTIILPEGTVGVIHVESSTNLVQWADEWVHTFANTNENRFFRLRAERSLP